MQVRCDMMDYNASEDNIRDKQCEVQKKGDAS